MTLPRHNLPEKGVEAKVAYQLLHDELELDGNPNMNLASFVHTWVPDECRKLMNENLSKNLADQDEYPAATEIHNRCVVSAVLAALTPGHDRWSVERSQGRDQGHGVHRLLGGDHARRPGHEAPLASQDEGGRQGHPQPRAQHRHGR
jgi:hypothetical protein